MELRPDYKEFLHWCINWCVSRRGKIAKLTRTALQEAWKAADEFDYRINLDIAVFHGDRLRGKAQ
jgi:hypothetical protein